MMSTLENNYQVELANMNHSNIMAEARIERAKELVRLVRISSKAISNIASAATAYLSGISIIKTNVPHRFS